MMKFTVVDVQGFCIPDFFPKELAIYDGKDMKTYVFKPKIPFHMLSEDYQRQIKYLYGNHHGIHYNYGEIDYEEIYSIICKNLRDVNVIYTKGEVKRKFLVKIYSEIKHKIPNIVNLEFCHGNIPKLSKNTTLCNYHNLEICMCSVKNAYVLYNYIFELLPQ